MSDAAGTLLLDEGKRDWSDEVVAACCVERAALPRLLEGSAPSGALRRDVLSAWGLERDVVVAAGAGDAAAGAIGIGAIGDGDSFISLGTSAQFFVARDRYEPKPETLIHAFAHALPGRWFEMAAMLNGATVLDWIARILGEPDIGALIDRVAARFIGPSPIIFLPYLSGERTPHNDADARGVFFGLDASAGRDDLVQAVLEGVVFSLMDARLALGAAGHRVAAIAAVGGGVQSRFWMKLIAGGLGIPILRHAGAGKGPAFGAARLARLALDRRDPASRLRASPQRSRPSNPISGCTRLMASASPSTAGSTVRSGKLAKPGRIGSRPRRRDRRSLGGEAEDVGQFVFRQRRDPLLGQGAQRREPRQHAGGERVARPDGVGDLHPHRRHVGSAPRGQRRGALGTPR